MIPYSTSNITPEDISAVTDVLHVNYLTRGNVTREFEDACQNVTGKKHNIFVSNGTMGLFVALACIEPSSDRIITTPLTFCAVANAAYWNGMHVRFCDVDPETLCPEFPALTDDDKHIIPVGLDYAGYPSLQFDPGYPNILDACHSFGGRLENGDPSCKYATVAVYSFHPAKQITSGEGGLVSTDSDRIAEGVRGLRDNGRSNGLFCTPGMNLHGDEMSAALALSQLKRLPDNLSRRRSLAHRYFSAFHPDLRLILPIDHPGHAYHLFPVQFSNAVTESVEILQKDLLEMGVGTQRHYRPLNTMPFFRARNNPSMPIAEHAYERMLSIPMYYGLTDAQQDHVIESINRTLDKYSK